MSPLEIEICIIAAAAVTLFFVAWLLDRRAKREASAVLDNEVAAVARDIVRQLDADPDKLAAVRDRIERGARITDHRFKV